MQKIRFDSVENLLDDYYDNKEKYRSIIFICNKESRFKLERLHDINHGYVYRYADKMLLGAKCVIDNEIDGLFMMENNYTR